MTRTGTTTRGRRREVAIVDGQIPHYRVPFHVGLRDRLDRMDIDYTLVYGIPHGEDRRKQDWTTLNFAHLRNPRIVRIGSKAASYQPCLRLVRSADLVIGIQQASRLTNYPLWLRYLTGRQRFALWGHGVNFKRSEASRAGELVKRVMSRHVHWWFAYNDRVAHIVSELGFPADRITSVQNAIDTDELRADLADVTDAQLADYRASLGLTGDNVCLYIGGMYREKRLAYLLAAGDHIREVVPDFEMLFVGGGPDEDIVTAAAARRSWIHHLGPRFRHDRALALRASKLLLMPGLVGLAILDAFAAGVPLVTVGDSEHSPEIDYLDDGVNGRMVPGGTDAAGYAEHVAALLRDEPTRQKLVDGGLEASHRYTIAAMVDRFADGIAQALDR